jgi:hypothetical protein
MIKKLVQSHVAVTSTLVIFETFAPEQPPVQSRILQALSRPLVPISSPRGRK